MKQPAFPRTRRQYRDLRDRFSGSRYDGMGGWEPDSSDIPVIEALCYVVGTAAAVWAVWQIAKFIVGAA